MLRPVDLQVLVSRTHEVQKYQGVVTKMNESEGENFRRRLQNQVKEEQQQVQRKKNVLAKRVTRRQEQDSSGGREQQDSQRKKEQQEDVSSVVTLTLKYNKYGLKLVSSLVRPSEKGSRRSFALLLGILIFLHILCVGLCLLLFLGLKELARRQRQLADRLGVVEELVIELSSATLESSGQDDTEQGALARHEAETRRTRPVSLFLRSCLQRKNRSRRLISNQ